MKNLYELMLEWFERDLDLLKEIDPSSDSKYVKRQMWDLLSTIQSSCDYIKHGMYEIELAN